MMSSKWNEDLEKIKEYAKNSKDFRLLIKTNGGSLEQYSESVSDDETKKLLEGSLTYIKSLEKVADLKVVEEKSGVLRVILGYGDDSMSVADAYSLNGMLGDVFSILKGADAIKQYANQNKKIVSIITNKAH